MTKKNDVLSFEEVLQKLNLFDVALSSYNGYVTRKDSVTDELRTAGSFKVMDPDELRPFTNMRQEVRRACLKYGVSFMGGHAIPDSSVEELANQLKDIGLRYETQKKYFIDNYDQILTNYANRQNAEDRAEIMARAPHVDYVRSQIRFSLRVVKITPQSETLIKCGASDGVEDDIKGLGSQLIHEIAQEVRDGWKSSSSAGEKSVAFLERIIKKIDSLSFIDFRVAKLSSFLKESMKSMPSGVLSGHNFLVFSGLMSILSDEKMMASGNLSLSASFQPLESNAKASKKTDRSFKGDLNSIESEISSKVDDEPKIDEAEAKFLAAQTSLDLTPPSDPELVSNDESEETSVDRDDVDVPNYEIENMNQEIGVSSYGW